MDRGLTGPADQESRVIRKNVIVPLSDKAINNDLTICGLSVCPAGLDFDVNIYALDLLP